MRKLSKSTEDLSSTGRYRSVEDLSCEFNEAEEEGHVAVVEQENDVFQVDLRMPGPTVQELVEVYEKCKLQRDNEKEVKGWITLSNESKEFDKDEELQQCNTLAAILKEKGNEGFFTHGSYIYELYHLRIDNFLCQNPFIIPHARI